MARVLVSSIPVAGHINPLVPVVRALCARGHEVVWYTGAKYRSRVEATGARFAGRVHARDYDDADVARDNPESAKLHVLAWRIIDNAGGALRDLQDIAAAFAPDVLLGEPGMYGGLFFSELSGVPLVVLGVVPITRTSIDTAPFGFNLAPSATPLGRLRNRFLNWTLEHVLLRYVQKHWNATRKELGLPATGWWLNAWERAAAYLQASIPALEHPRSDLPPNVRFIGMIPADSPEDWHPPEFWPELDSARAVVHVTQGTLANASADLIAPALAGLANEDVLVVVATGGRPPGELGLSSVPRNARIGTFLSYPELLPKTAVMVTNGGYGTVQMALASGVPLAVAGTSEDKGEIAVRVAGSGAGINLRNARPAPERVRRAVRRLLDDPSYRSRAAALAADYARYDAVALVVEAVEAQLRR